MTIELSETQKQIFDRILEVHERKRTEEDESQIIFLESEILSLKNSLMKSLGFKIYMRLLKEAAPLFY